MSSSILKNIDQSSSKIKGNNQLQVIQRYRPRPLKRPVLIQLVSKELYKNSKVLEQKNFDQNNPQVQIIQKQLKQKLSHQNKNKEKHQIQLAECQICLNEFQPQKMISLMGCQHKFCPQCTKSHFLNQISLKLPINCPKYKCEKKLISDSQHFKNLSPQEQIQFLKSEQQRKYLENGGKRLCPKSDCLGYMKRNKCQLCSAKACYACMNQYHEGQCDQKAIKRMKGRFGYKKCARCNMFVEKSYGCNHMTCTCGHEFCYTCGKDWSSHNSCQQQEIPGNLTFMEHIYWQTINRRNNVQFFHHSPSPILSQIEKYLYNRKDDEFSFPFLILYFILIYPIVLVACVLLLIYSFFIVHILILMGFILLSSCIYYDFTRSFNRKYRKWLWIVWILLLPISIVLTGILSFIVIWIAGHGLQNYFYKNFLIKQFKGIYCLILSVCMIYETQGFQFA